MNYVPLCKPNKTCFKGEEQLISKTGGMTYFVNELTLRGVRG